MNTGTNYSAAVDFVDNDNTWSAAEYNNAAKDNAALDAHWGAEMTYDYWLLNHSRNSYDNAGAKIKSYVHYANSYNNAYWNGSVMTYGDGSGPGGFDALTSIDVVAHEIGHAVMSNTANLTYSYESGAMNEGFSDIWGASIEHFTDPTKQHWLIGEEIEMRPGHIALRDMSNPNAEGQPDTYLGTNWYVGAADNGGVHTNSGVLNYWYYLVSDGGTGVNDFGYAYGVTGIGIDDAAKIAYRMINVYLTPGSQYIDARTAGIQSAIDLFGAGSAAEIAVTEAWCAVGVGTSCGGTNSCASTVTTYPYFESFENTLGLWTQGSGDDFDWTVYSGSTPSTATGPSSANTGSYYIYVESSNPNYPYKTAIVNSPCIDLTGMNYAKCKFSYHMYGGFNMGKLYFDASIDGGVTWNNIWAKSGNQGNQWHTAFIDLGAYAGNMLTLRFRGTTGNTWQGDMAVDGFALNAATFAGITGFAGENHVETTQSKTQLEDDFTNDEVSIYPNPVHERLNIEFLGEVLSDFRIINMVGETILKGKVAENGIDVSSLEKGLYLIEFSNIDKRLVKRFVKN